MAKSGKTQKGIRRVIRATSASNNRLKPILTSMWMVAGMVVALVILVLAAREPTRTENFAACNDSGCQNVKNGSYWMITECNAPGDPDGDQQLCSSAGRRGSCRSVPYCCPAAGAQWTTNMSACPLPTATRTPTVYIPPTAYPTSTHYPTNSPYPTYTRYPSQPPLPTSTRAPTSTRVPTSRPRDTSTPRPTSTTRPSVTPTPTPIPKLVDVCGKTCSTDSDCQLDLACSTVFGSLHACRNRTCPENPGCDCSGGGGPFTFMTPTPGPGMGDLRTLPVTVKRFTDSKSQTSTQPTFSGTSEPDSKVTITIYPDGVGGEVYADKNGNWTFRPTKKLTPGEKNLLVVATKPGAQGQVSQPFTVVGGRGINFGLILGILVLLALGFGVYVYVKSNQ